MNDKKILPDLPPINTYLLQPTDWAVEAMKRAAEYAGMPEGNQYTVEARRYLALGKRIQELEAQITANAISTSV